MSKIVVCVMDCASQNSEITIFYSVSKDKIKFGSSVSIKDDLSIENITIAIKNKIIEDMKCVELDSQSIITDVILFGGPS